MAGRNIMRGGCNVMGEGHFITGHNITWGSHNIMGCSEGCRIITFVIFGMPYVHPRG